MKILSSSLILTAFAWLMTTTAFAQTEPTVHFDFSSTSDVSGKYTGTLCQGAKLEKYGKEYVLSLGTDNGYFDLGAQIGEVIAALNGECVVSVNVFIPADADLSKNGNFIWCFANSSSTGYMFISAKDSRFAITLTDYTGEQGIDAKKAIEKGRWNNILFNVKGSSSRLYINGVSASKSIKIKPSELGETAMNYLGRSCYEGDAYLKGARYNDLRIYNGAMSISELGTIMNKSKELNAYEDSVEIDRQMRTFTLGDVSQLKEDIELPVSSGALTIWWETSNNNVITPEGHITRPVAGSDIAKATLTAHLSGGTQSMVRTFEVGVLPELSDEETVATDAENLPQHPLLKSQHLNNVYTNLLLPTVAPEGSAIFWKSADTKWITDEGRVVQLPEGKKKDIVLTATLVKNTARTTKDITVTLHEKEPYTNYLFVYFPSNSDENLYYALSNDGYNFTPMNNGRRVVAADSIALKRGVRDPHILRAPDGMFYMVNTDMRCSEGWDSNRGIVMMKSADLIHWTHSTVHFPAKYAGTMFEKVIRVWAPETIWDAEAGKLMVYFSLRTAARDGIPYDKDYYCYANDDFTDLEGEPIYFYDRGSATIDMNIVYNESDGLYHGFYKNEGEGGICKVTAEHLTARPGEPLGSQWSEPSGTLQQTNEAVEGAGVFKLINQDSWILMYDCYTAGHYQFCSSSDLSQFSFVQNTRTSGAFTPRHGTVIPITEAETAALLKKFPIDEVTPAIIGARNNHIRQSEMVIEEVKEEATTANIRMPLEFSADVENLDPQFFATPGSIISPQGPQDFSKGPVAYTVSTPDKQVTYSVTAEVLGNPVLPGFHADPEVLFSHKTGRFYIYPTTDGYTGWGGYSFDVFSSPDLLHFTNEGTILNLQRGKDVEWAAGNAWAPCIEEKLVGGKWRYYYYFSGTNTTMNKKTLGVAVSDNPTGPFRASSKPLFTSSAAGQMIDSDVFTDPVTGQSYLYYGNGQLCYRLLSDDMMSVGGTEYVITPTGGSLSDYAFREGAYVFYRNGLYYFLWSVDDTGSTNYHVAYGTSTSPTGPIQVAKRPIVIIQDAAHEIYGTGHNSIINIPGTDDWYIVYHRINKNYLNNGPGYHREVCIDRMTFNEDGTIHQVIPTHGGISPVIVENLDDLISGIEELSDPHPSTPNTQHPSPTITYYNANGVALGAATPSQRGFYVRQERLADGTTRSLKVLVK